MSLPFAAPAGSRSDDAYSSGETCHLRRKFHRPTGLDSAASVKLVVAANEWEGSVQLNAELIGRLPRAGGHWEVDVLQRLQPVNELEISLDGTAAVTGVIEDVYLSLSEA